MPPEINFVVSNAGPKLGRLTLVIFVESKLTIMRAVGIVWISVAGLISTNTVWL